MSRPRLSPWRDGVLGPAPQTLVVAEAEADDEGQDQAPGEGEAQVELEADLEDVAALDEWPAADEQWEPPALEPPTIEVAPEPETIPRQIIAVVAAKGGVGKTTIATNLAVGLAKQAPLSVVLVDADVQFGDVAMALSLTPARCLPDAVTEAAASDAMVLKAYLTAHPDGYYVVCGAESPADGDRVTGEQLGHLIRQLAGIFRFVIIDTAPGLGEHALAALEAATDAVFLCDMSVPGARGLRKELAVLATIGILPPARHVVLNFADRVSGLSVKDVEATIGVPVDVAVPRSSLVSLSTNRGIPLLHDGKRSPASAALTELVRRFDPSAAIKRGRLHRRVVVS